LSATVLDIIEPAESVTDLEQITAVGRFGWDDRLSGALKAAQSIARPRTRHTRPPETELRDG